MTALELVTGLVGVLCLASAACFALLAARALRSARALEAAALEFESEAVPTLHSLREAVERAGGQVERIDDVLDLAESIGGRVDSATELTYKVLTAPVIKGVAIASGSKRAASRLRRSEPSQTAVSSRDSGRKRRHRRQR